MDTDKFLRDHERMHHCSTSRIWSHALMLVWFALIVFAVASAISIYWPLGS